MRRTSAVALSRTSTSAACSARTLSVRSPSPVHTAKLSNRAIFFFGLSPSLCSRSPFPSRFAPFPFCHSFISI
jgi:hypothetical protein